MVGRGKHAALDSHAGFSECGRGTLLGKIVKKDSGSAGNKTGNKARDDKHAHRTPPFSRGSSRGHQSSFPQPNEVVERKRTS
jgi:hypothetical protein